MKFFLTLRSNPLTHEALFLPSGMTQYQSNPFLCLTALFTPKVSFHIQQFQGPAVLGSSICFSQDCSQPWLCPLPCPIWISQLGERGEPRWRAVDQLFGKKRRGSPSSWGKMLLLGGHAWSCLRIACPATLRGRAGENAPTYFLQSWHM